MGYYKEIKKCSTQREMIDRIEYHVEHAVDYEQTATIKGIHQDFYQSDPWSACLFWLATTEVSWQIENANSSTESKTEGWTHGALKEFKVEFAIGPRRMGIFYVFYTKTTFHFAVYFYKRTNR